jgi:DNA-binding NarL/FixJ family response regulator
MTMPATRVAPAQRIRVLLADDHAVFRQGLRRLLETERDFLVVGEAANSEEAVALVSQLRPDILLLDLSMPGGSGLEALTTLARIDVAVKVVVLTAEIEREQIVRALQLGARGVLLKSSAADLIFKGLRTIMAGQHWVDRQTVTDLVELVKELSGSPRQPSSNKFGLTRESRHREKARDQRGHGQAPSDADLLEDRCVEPTRAGAVCDASPTRQALTVRSTTDVPGPGTNGRCARSAVSLPLTQSRHPCPPSGCRTLERLVLMEGRAGLSFFRFERRQLRSAA